MSQPIHSFVGVHVFGELYGVAPKWLDRGEPLAEVLRTGIARSGATLCGVQCKNFLPSGTTLLALLSESHASVHTYPEEGALFFDAFTCGTRCRPAEIAHHLIEVIVPGEWQLTVVERGLNGGLRTDHLQSARPLDRGAA